MRKFNNRSQILLSIILFTSFFISPLLAFGIMSKVNYDKPFNLDFSPLSSINQESSQYTEDPLIKYFIPLDRNGWLKPCSQAEVDDLLSGPPHDIVRCRDPGCDHSVGVELGDYVMGDPCNVPVDAELLRAPRLEPADTKILCRNEPG